MLIKPDCISCILKMAITAIRNLTTDEAVIRDLTIQILTIPALQGRQWDLSSPEVIEQVMEKIVRRFPFPGPVPGFEVRTKSDRSSPLSDGLKKLVQEADDPLQAAVKMAILGNAIDLMISDQSLDVEKTLVQGLRATLVRRNRSRSLRKNSGKPVPWFTWGIIAVRSFSISCYWKLFERPIIRRWSLWSEAFPR